MNYLGEYLIPLAAIILVIVVWMWEEIVVGVRLVKLFIKRKLGKNLKAWISEDAS
jgi:hypothetical protein